ncbi:MAG: MBL fold metallo-hydrolase [Pseudomonadales bacterium]|jgi:glyoxylase-like metal-dependent hydrolase (beta-lactamase superfamily II)|nr:MBL fold metallo-hydrolase [Pseudomonadales bacterium]MDP7359853.1 MBL fold metallo-hydrolase [Pseudomonadales bacterium]MDP7595720.1 MBL fold metallo-hydrolase [Pseudomonadales bacterium]HJN49165.1 MBL fold metallo-hydrolase [Pseudomonadales bacterium]|tara:strand:+ start:1797 stop:2492 length:696 start_codon:yes stop_codon:yes gene_type:complete
MQIHRVKSRGANSYVIDEHDRLMVIDVAFMAEKSVMAYVTDTMNRNLQEVDLVLCTHGHTDHMGGVRRLARHCQAEIGIPSSTSLWQERLSSLLFLPLLAGWLVRRSTSLVFRKESGSSIQPEPYFDPPVIKLEPADSLRGFDNWITIHTPGHTADSYCYFHLPSKSLISGDTLLASGKDKRLVLPAIYNSRSKLQRSIAELRNLNPASVHPGHGSVLFGSHLLDNIVGSS